MERNTAFKLFSRKKLDGGLNRCDSIISVNNVDCFVL